MGRTDLFTNGRLLAGFYVSDTPELQMYDIFAGRVSAHQRIGYRS